MKKTIAILSVLLALHACTQEIPEIQVIPQPNSITVSGALFKISGMEVSLDGLDGESSELVLGFISRLEKVTGRGIRTVPAGKGNFSFIRNGTLSEEEYQLEITPDHVEVEASSSNGFLYALQTMSQMLPVEFYAGEQNRQVKWVLPCAKIKDSPRFRYRGLLLDVCRHFYPVAQIRKMIDVMSMHKLNVLHLHLTEDQGWRIEIKKYPELTRTGAYRDGSMLGHFEFGKEDEMICDSVRYGGFYTQNEIRGLVSYAEKRGIMIVPEIDFPGHMMAAMASYPELGCTGGPYEVRKLWGIAEESLCLGKESTFRFLEDVLDEVMELFPSGYIHLGGDECMKGTWEKCPDCQNAIRRLGLQDDERFTKEQHFQIYATERMQRYLNEHGRKLVGWDEILEGNLAEGATVMSWRGAETGIEAAARGFDCIMTSGAYFDFYQAEDTSLEPLAIGNYLPLEGAYNYTVIDRIPEEARGHLIGVQANLWTEYIARPEHLEYMALPRMAAISEVQWCNGDNKDYGRFVNALTKHMMKIYDITGYTYCKEILGQHGLPGVEGGTN